VKKVLELRIRAKEIQHRIDAKVNQPVIAFLVAARLKVGAEEDDN
jgi:hypothetical protein